MRLETEVEMDESFTGMRLSSLDLSEVRVFDVSMKNNSRNMLHGQSVLHRHARGSLGCYTAYKCSLYPPSLTVSHHFKGAVVSVSKIVGQTIERDPLPPQQQRKGKDKGKATRQKFPGKACAAASFSNTTYKPTFYVVTIHGVMTWRAPSMRRYECIRAAYDRVITLVENAVCANNSVEASRSAPLLVYNDQLYLRPQRTDNIRSFACYVAPTPEHVARLVVEFGLEACPDGVKLVHAVAERSSSNASTIAALRRLVFGELEDDIHDDTTSGGATVIDCNSYKNNSGGSTDIANSVAPESDDVGAVGVDQALVYFDIYSLLTAETSVAAASDGSAVECPPHRVTLEDVDAVVAATNDRYTSTFKAGVGR
ncbi:unnamed protein product [Trypanosoma congolense IL3000]|uniref:WGS project CAEQ00000000 data, annotated contig 701 n=1 Tax=Trypanosoma congolense (strain IL3000) TaxID=1068625 RepID=F9WHX1_TRYCI|nr:unnamed protein product [Trypanosoma congolense IL3000]